MFQKEVRRSYVKFSIVSTALVLAVSSVASAEYLRRIRRPLRITHSKWRAFELRSNDRSTSHAALWDSRRGLSQRVRYGTDHRPRPFCTRQAHRLVAGRGTGDQATSDRARYN
jgi:hypothetical protein